MGDDRPGGVKSIDQLIEAYGGGSNNYNSKGGECGFLKEPGLTDAESLIILMGNSLIDQCTTTIMTATNPQSVSMFPLNVSTTPSTTMYFSASIPFDH